MIVPLEVVLASDEAAMAAHKELYHFPDESYRIVSAELLETVEALDGGMHKLHISANWTDIIKLAVWRSVPKAGDALVLLRTMGISHGELIPFKDANISDLFPWLYYGKGSVIMRKICIAAKTNTEKHIRRRDMRVHCHLSSREVSRIVASSL